MVRTVDTNKSERMNASDASLPASSKLSKTLRARHLAMISIGGIIGAGVFVGSSTAISTIGPAVVLSYIFAGIVVFMVIKILARMAIDQPASARSPNTCASRSDRSGSSAAGCTGISG
jgi:L-asparagine transporter-like permease